MTSTSPSPPATTNTATMDSSSSTDEVSSTAPIVAAQATPGALDKSPVSTSQDEAAGRATAASNATTAVAVDAVEPVKPSEPEAELKAPASPLAISPTPAASLTITVLVQSGVKHQFTLDIAYLERHQVKSETGTVNNPSEMTVWQLKECVWKDWREDWDQRPASALFIKLIHFGAYLNDGHMLSECRLSSEAPNVIHMVIRPAEAGDDDGTQRSTKGAFGTSRDREGASRSPSCRCVIL